MNARQQYQAAWRQARLIAPVIELTRASNIEFWRRWHRQIEANRLPLWLNPSIKMCYNHEAAPYRLVCAAVNHLLNREALTFFDNSGREVAGSYRKLAQLRKPAREMLSFARQYDFLILPPAPDPRRDLYDDTNDLDRLSRAEL